ncbi:hypothetical protein [Saccharopolyspora pogona]|uniref:hypothetical protein n=1 Tax=Saccharopolyspora pogona TaxID=333966 RepID=UPI001682BDC0|nr:hypothetical protein [Saccharopolyspora pogona]
MHSAVVSERDKVAAVRGEGGPSDDPAGQDGHRGAEHRDPPFAVADRDDRDVAVQHGECGIGGGSGVSGGSGGDHGPSRVFAEHDHAPGGRLAERRERPVAAGHGNGSGRAVRFRRRDEPGTGAVEPPVQQPGLRGGEDVRLTGAGQEHRDGVVDPGAAEVRPSCLVGEPDAHTATGVADRDQHSPSRCRDRRRRSDLAERRFGRRKAEILPAVLPAFQEDHTRAVLDHKGVRAGEPRRTGTRHETTGVHNGLT